MLNSRAGRRALHIRSQLGVAAKSSHMGGAGAALLPRTVCAGDGRYYRHPNSAQYLAAELAQVIADLIIHYHDIIDISQPSSLRSHS